MAEHGHIFGKCEQFYPWGAAKRELIKSEHSIKILQTPLKFMFEYSAEQGPYFASTSKIGRTICFPLC